MKYIYSKIEPKKLLHIINKMDDIVDRTNVVPDYQFLQLATLRMEKGKTFKPHQHIWKTSTVDRIIAQESWIVVKGSVKVYMYDIDGTLLTTEIINQGDCSMTFEGGHTYESLEDDTVVYEYKTGPYTGIENDKVFL
jgi:cupin fold WbuC family metalloprotein